MSFATILETLNRKGFWSGELKHRRKDGSLLVVESRWALQRDAAGRPKAVMEINTDITVRKRAEMEVRHAGDVAEAANHLKSEFMANMSHELRTPLNGIIGFAEFLVDEKRGSLNEKQKEYLNDILDSGRHLLQLINDILDLSKVEAGKMEFIPEEFAVRKAVEEVCAVISPLSKKKNISLRVEVSPAVESVMLDQQKFKQVLYNLLSNAVKFTDNGGKVRLGAAWRDRDRLELQVSDTGIGIKAEDFPKLFTEFTQLDSGSHRRYDGTGLGLALTKKIVEFQNGSISVKSKFGEGSVFTVVLPVARAGKP